MNAFLHKLAGLARTIPPFHESHAVWRAPREVAAKSARAANRCHDGRTGASRKWIIAGLR